MTSQAIQRKKSSKAPLRLKVLPNDHTVILPLIPSPSSSFSQYKTLKSSPLSIKHNPTQSKSHLQSPLKKESQLILPIIHSPIKRSLLNESIGSHTPSNKNKVQKNLTKLHTNERDSVLEEESSLELMSKEISPFGLFDAEGSPEKSIDKYLLPTIQVDSSRYQRLTVSTFKRKEDRRQVQTPKRNFDFSKPHHPIDEYNSGLSVVSDDNKSSRRGSILSQSILLEFFL